MKLLWFLRKLEVFHKALTHYLVDALIIPWNEKAMGCWTKFCLCGICAHGSCRVPWFTELLQDEVTPEMPRALMEEDKK